MIKKLFVYLQVYNIDGDVKFSVDNAKHILFKNELWEIELEHDISTTSRFKINLTENLGSQSHLIIKDVVLDGVKLHNLDTWGKYIVDGEENPLSTYGYMNRPGYYILNIHQSSLVHNYISYFQSRCK